MLTFGIGLWPIRDLYGAEVNIDKEKKIICLFHSHVFGHKFYCMSNSVLKNICQSVKNAKSIKTKKISLS
jgi:hypothetical protein